MMSVTSDISSRPSTISSKGVQLRCVPCPIDPSVRSRVTPGPTRRSSLPRPSGHDPPPRHRVQVEHASAVADGGVEILLRHLVEVELGVDVIDDAGLAREVKAVRLVADLPRLRDDLVPQLIDLLSSDGKL